MDLQQQKTIFHQNVYGLCFQNKISENISELMHISIQVIKEIVIDSHSTNIHKTDNYFTPIINAHKEYQADVNSNSDLG